MSSRISVGEILGDSLPAGRYYFVLSTSYEVLAYPRLPGPDGPLKPYVFSGGDAMLRR